jgi:hypothetical protein
MCKPARIVVLFVEVVITAPTIWIKKALIENQQSTIVPGTEMVHDIRRDETPSNFPASNTNELLVWQAVIHQSP